MTSSLPELLKEWYDWYIETIGEDHEIATDSLAGRTREALDRHERSVKFFDMVEDLIARSTLDD